MDNQNKISVLAVVVTYNRIEILKKCIKALKKQDFDGRLSILVVDNCSKDGTHDFCTNQEDKDFIYYRSNENLGGSGGFNIGIKQACRYNFDYVWVMDDDCVPSNTAVKNFFMSNLELDKIGFLASKVKWADNSICKVNIPKRSIWKFVKKFEGKPQRIIIASFVSILIPMKVVREVGFPIKDFFILADDYEYTRRISRQYPSYYIPESEVKHLAANNYGPDIARLESNQIPKLERMYRNDTFVYSREGLMGNIFIFAREIVHTIKVLLFAKDNKSERIKAIWRGTKSGRKFNPVIESYSDEQS